MSNYYKNYSRRRFLTHTSLGVAATLLPNWSGAMQGMAMLPQMPKRTASPTFKPDVEFELRCERGAVPILTGQQTRVFQYRAKLLKGPDNTLVTLPDSYLGPLIQLQRGQKVRIHLQNALPEASVTHWHGLHVPAEMDGHPVYAINPGESLVYEFEVLNRAGLHIYHPHPHEATATQVYYGLAGAIRVSDAEETALELPSGAYELPIVIQDRAFDADNQLAYGHGMHASMMGNYGDRILVNGRADYQLDVDSRAYRLRIMNGSNARIYKLGWDDGTPITVLGVDGGLLAAPEVKPYLMLAPGERLDVWADFSGRNPGTLLTLRSLAFSGALPSMGMMMNHSSLPLGSDFPIMTFKIARKIDDSPKLPKQLASLTPLTLNQCSNPNQPRPIAISEGHMAMLLNGHAYEYNNPLPTERIPVNTIQLMEIFHEHGGHGGMGMGRRHGSGGGRHGRMGMMMSMAHPIHLHGQQFQIISRSIEDADDAGYASVRDGFIESGLKDTVLVMPGETVRIIKPFQDFKGLFMYHCHNLEHEDMGMMREFLIE
ncbi:multicopper oxidase family protein [Methylocucumis oryzae]|uniref:Multicopper oxidase CueO n=1 Tax=Methylocucumis oryzae TaxID=1632867 RepID=A0A0F3IHM6_9GAMM|nr:multicopper oxidase domain-containing protein [Methylocucumis oryzae]KJV06300.1 bilirubin oxidase [Methylocucumis oryzae]